MTYHELDGKELKEAHKYFDFIKWLYENGWEPYVDPEYYVRQAEYGFVLKQHVDALWRTYFAELPQSIKDLV